MRAVEAEGPDPYLTLPRASELVGIDQETLRVLAVRGRLRSVRRGGAHLTTPRWLQEYLTSRAALVRVSEVPRVPHTR